MRDTAEARELVCVWGKRFGGKVSLRYSRPYPKSTVFFGTNPQERSELEEMKDGLLKPVAGDYAWRSSAFSRRRVRRLSPVSAIERAIMDRFGDVVRLDLVGIFEVGDRAADFQDPIVGARGQAQTRHGAFQHRFALRINPAVAANQTGRHCGVRKDSIGCQPRPLSLPRFDYTLANAG